MPLGSAAPWPRRDLSGSPTTTFDRSRVAGPSSWANRLRTCMINSELSTFSLVSWKSCRRRSQRSKFPMRISLSNARGTLTSDSMSAALASGRRPCSRNLAERMVREVFVEVTASSPAGGSGPAVSSRPPGPSRYSRRRKVPKRTSCSSPSFVSCPFPQTPKASAALLPVLDAGPAASPDRGAPVVPPVPPSARAALGLSRH
mmetsp:Transcript_48574/g.150399  ORF Transcript_48574/g.150399 Transcript_48574/m.150399 type:complete len:202 (-) Transcript_48574:375-980(-)